MLKLNLLRTKLLILFAVFSVFSWWGPAHATYVPNQVIVKYKIPVHREVDGKMQLKKINIPLRSSTILTKIGAVPLKRFDEHLNHLKKDPPLRSKNMAGELPAQFQNLYKLKITVPVEEALEYLAQDPNVEYAEPNYLVKILDTTPNDPHYSDQWGLPQISAPGAWDVTCGSSSVVVAVIDTGVNYNHEDLTSKVTLGYNFVAETSDPNDDNGHGSEVAGIIGANTNNAIGIAGLGWSTQILAVKVLYSTGTGEVYDVAQGIQYAADRAQILNLSLGDYEPSILYTNAVNYAVEQGCLVIAAAGNDGTSQKVYPAACSGVVAVAATDQDDKRSVWSSSQSSNYGTWITVCAPGTSIYSTRLGNSYYSASGTSMATPYVAGLAALIWAINPGWTATQVKEQITSTADDIDAVNIGYEGLLGSGRINAEAAAGYPLASISSPTARQTIQGTVSIIGSATGDAFSYYKIEVGSGESPASWTQIGENHTTPVTDGLLETWATSPGANGTHIIKLTVSASTENTYEVTVNVQNPTSLVTSAKAGPNPFNPEQQSFIIQFDLSTGATITIYIYDIAGNLVWAVSQPMAYGFNQINWDGKNHYGNYIGNGVYFYRIATNHTLLGSGKIIVYR